MNFRELGLSETFSERLAGQNIREATPIQRDLFAPILAGSSVLGLAKTGTGKTLSYCAPLVEKLSKLNSESSEPLAPTTEGASAWAWILVPTRELAVQVKDTLTLLTSAESQTAVVVGGESEERQIDALQKARFVVATPGRLLDLLKQRKILTRDVDVVVMDEADRLLDMGFIDDIRAILAFLRKKPQLICVSATLNLGVEEVAFELGVEPLRFGVEEAVQTVDGLDHRVAFVGDEEKFHVLSHFIHDRKDQRGIVFSNYRERAHELASRLRGLGCKADALSSQLPQSARRRIIEDYRSGELKVLVGSDLAARGLDFLDVDYVINFDLSEDAATYVHRVGRTARAGRKGQALSLIGFEDSFRIEKLERFLNAKIPTEEVPLGRLTGPLPRFGARITGSHDQDMIPPSRGRGGPSSRGPRDGGSRGRPQAPRSVSNEGSSARTPHSHAPSRSNAPSASPRPSAHPAAASNPPAERSHAARPAAAHAASPRPAPKPQHGSHVSGAKKDAGFWMKFKRFFSQLFKGASAPRNSAPAENAAAKKTSGASHPQASSPRHASSPQQRRRGGRNRPRRGSGPRTPQT